jgi:hypothetical protein
MTIPEKKNARHERTSVFDYFIRESRDESKAVPSSAAEALC